MAPPRRPGTIIGLDVGKSSHWACVATRDGEVLASKPIANTQLAPRFSAPPSPAQHAAQAKLNASRSNQKRGAPAPADAPPQFNPAESPPNRDPICASPS